MRLLVLALSLLLAACGGETPETPAQPAEPEPSTEAADQPDPRAPVVVYASYEDGNYLPQWFALFTEATGIRVQVRTRDQATNVNDVIANRGTPPADVLIVNDVYELWRASDEGALRPLSVENLDSLVDPRFQDPDGQWVGFSVNPAFIVYRREEQEEDGDRLAIRYSDLGADALRGRVCLTTSQLPSNRALIAMLIDELGVRPAEIVVREWIRNLAAEPFESDERLLAAMNAGTCGIGIVSSQGAYAAYNDRALGVLFAQPTYANIEGVAVVRHAREPDKANRLVAWMLHEANQHRHAMAVKTVPAGPIEIGMLHNDVPDVSGSARAAMAEREVSVIGWRGEEAALLAERARYR